MVKFLFLVCLFKMIDIQEKQINAEIKQGQIIRDENISSNL